jgi:hypothetical protein
MFRLESTADTDDVGVLLLVGIGAEIYVERSGNGNGRAGKRLRQVAFPVYLEVCSTRMEE